MKRWNYQWKERETPDRFRDVSTASRACVLGMVFAIALATITVTVWYAEKPKEPPLADTQPALWRLPDKGPQQLVILDVIDGDTVRAAYLTGPVIIRIDGIAAPELRTPEGKASKVHLQRLLLTGVSQRWELRGKEKYGRQLADTWIDGDSGGWLSAIMVNSKKAKIWDGKGEQPK